MTIPVNQIDPELVSVALTGFHRALIRLRADVAAAPEGDDGLTALTSATECLYWACAIEETARKSDPTFTVHADSYGQALVHGARWARNQSTHQLAFVVAKPSGAVTWRPAADLPAPERESGRQRTSYDAHLAGTAVLQTFERIAGFFASEQNRTGSLLNSAITELTDLRALGGSE
ncbi:hypothetical protein [Streptomyces sp. NRRL B-24484]|uniref:hypothetical protein n=1 Tax=Streptomyces sp. NRRL B-24484 TaxID=1463833 RepID=UPI0004BF45E7|nr:hypothetical protein [Streptomyces sp. NRRL B-24484]